jgi:polyisoprenoid-binding protein YceI
MMIRSLTALAVSLAAAYPAAAADWTPDYEASRLTFTGTQQGSEFQGSFGAFDVQISFDPDDPAAGSLAVSVDISSIDAGSEQRNSVLPSDAWFAAQDYPTATFSADSFRHEGGDRYVAEGELTIRSVSMPLDLPFMLSIEGDRAVAEGGVTLDRLDYNLGTGRFEPADTVGHSVEVTFHLEATRAE